MMKLEQEWSGILNWLIEGCRQWMVEGLQDPDEVKIATNEYRSASDSFGQFLDEQCAQGPDEWVKTSILYNEYESWCKANGVRRILTGNSFTDELGRRGFNKKKKDNARGWLGVGLRRPLKKVGKSTSSTSGTSK